MKKIDVLFSFDTTGSMYPCLSEVRRRCSEVVKKLFGEIEGIRIGIIAHGDYCDKGNPYIIKGLDMSRNEDDIVKFVNGVKPTFGGDWEECYELVLNKVQDMDWRSDADAKILVMIGDATPHLKGYRYGGETCIHDWKEECGKLEKLGIKVYAVQAMASARRTVERRFYETMSSLTHGVKIDLHQLSDIVHLFRGVCYQQAGPEQFQAYEDDIKASGKLNRSIAAMLDTLAGRKKAKYTFEPSGPLKPVDPSRFQVVRLDSDAVIKSFVVDEIGAVFNVGRGFYQWTKTETIQEKKEVILRDKGSGDMWTGPEARDIIGVPWGSRGRLRPGSLPKYDVFIQSTSWNRKLKGNTDFLYENPEWDRAS